MRPKITFMGAGSSVFAKSVLGDCMLTEALQDAEISLYDIDSERLRKSHGMIETLNANINGNRAKITAHLGVSQRKAALKGTNFIVNAIQVGGYKPSTVIDFEIPKKYGLRQTIADTLGIGGIFRALRTIPVMMDFACDIEAVAPSAWLLNYSNPMAMLTGAMLRGTSVRTVGLCHSVQGCLKYLTWILDLNKKYAPSDLRQKIAGVNHMAWLIEARCKGKDIYPEIRRAAAEKIAEIKKLGGAGKLAAKWAKQYPGKMWYEIPGPLARVAHDMVRLDMLVQFGFYITESSEHNAEYTPYWIKRNYPELIDIYGIPLDEYPRRCIGQIKGWKTMEKQYIGNPDLKHTRSIEYGAGIMESLWTDKPSQIGGNVLNHGIIPNLPANACVEVPCLVDGNGVQGCFVGDLPEPCAALNRTNINVHLLTIEAALELRRDRIYQAAILDPHTAAELSIDDIKSLCDDLIKAHGNWLPKYK